MPQVTPVKQVEVSVKPALKIGGPKLAAAEAAPAAVEPKPTAPAADLAAEQAKLKTSMEQLTQQARRHAVERQKFAEEKKAVQKEVEEAKAWRAQREQLKLNPEAFLKGELGEDYYDKLTTMRLSGGAPPAQVVAAEIKALNDKWEQRFKQEFETRDNAAKTAQQQQEKSRVDSARRAVQLESSDYIKASGKEHPILSAMGDEAFVGGLLAQRIEQEYGKSERRDSNTGELLMPGKVLSPKEAADLVEQDILALVEKVTATEKWKSRGKVQSGELPQQRRTLTNSTTGRTAGKAPPISDEERRERSTAAFNAVYFKNRNGEQ